MVLVFQLVFYVWLLLLLLAALFAVARNVTWPVKVMIFPLVFVIWLRRKQIEGDTLKD